MNAFSDFVGRAARALLRLLLTAAVALFILSLLMATLVLMLVLTIWSIVSGRKPDPARIFGQFRQTSARYTRGAWPGRPGPIGGRAPAQADVVDVPAHEVREAPQAYGTGGSDKPKPSTQEPMARVRH